VRVDSIYTCLVATQSVLSLANMLMCLSSRDGVLSEWQRVFSFHAALTSRSARISSFSLTSSFPSPCLPIITSMVSFTVYLYQISFSRAPVERLRLAKRRMDALKASPEAYLQLHLNQARAIRCRGQSQQPQRAEYF
jgi:hypothetical protein